MQLQFTGTTIIRTLMKMALEENRLKAGGNQSQVLGIIWEEMLQSPLWGNESNFTNRRQSRKLATRVETGYTGLTIEKGIPEVAPGRKEALNVQRRVLEGFAQPAHQPTVTARSEILQLLLNGNSIKSGLSTTHKIHYDLLILTYPASTLFPKDGTGSLLRICFILQQFRLS